MEPGFIDNFVSQLVEVVFIVLASLLSFAVFKLRQKFNIQMTAETEQLLDQGFHRLVGRVEEEFRARTGVQDEATESNPLATKLEAAMALARQQWPHLSDSEIYRRIHEAIAFTPGVGATGDDLTSS